MSGAALGLYHSMPNPGIRFSMVSCCARVCRSVVSAGCALGSRSRSLVMTLVMKAHSIMVAIRFLVWYTTLYSLLRIDVWDANIKG